MPSARNSQKQTAPTPTRLALAKAYSALGHLYLFSGAPEHAIQHLQNATAILETMLVPGVGEEVRSLLSSVYLAIGKGYASPAGSNPGDTRSALSYMRSALNLQERLAADFPNNIDHQHRLTAIHHALSLLYSAMGEREEELEQNGKAVEAARRVVAAQGENPIFQRELAVQLGNRGSVLVQLNEPRQALEHFREARAIYEQLRASGKLNDADTSKPDELTLKIAECETALQR